MSDEPGNVDDPIQFEPAPIPVTTRTVKKAAVVVTRIPQGVRAAGAIWILVGIGLFIGGIVSLFVLGISKPGTELSISVIISLCFAFFDLFSAVIFLFSGVKSWEGKARGVLLPGLLSLFYTLRLSAACVLFVWLAEALENNPKVPYGTANRVLGAAVATGFGAFLQFIAAILALVNITKYKSWRAYRLEMNKHKK